MAALTGMTAHQGIILCGHGSRDIGAVAEFENLATVIRRRFPDQPVAYGFLEFAQPIIRDGLDKLHQAGVREILAVPGMLFAAGHAKNDIPSVLNRWQADHPEVTVRYGRELGVDLKLLRAAGDRVAAALTVADATHGKVGRHDTLLVVVGRGASDPDANSNVAKMTRLLWESMGFGWAEVAYSGVTFPLVEPALEHAAKLGYRRIIVFPYFLFTGILVQRIYDAADTVARRHPHIAFVKAPYLSDHPLVVDAFIERLGEILAGTGNMNCQMCKYREAVLGFEDEVGLPQQSHHHHVEGIGTGSHTDDHEHNHDHKHDHEHDDHHHHHGHSHHHGSGHHHGHKHSHEHIHHHDKDHKHDDHGHHPYPHADHPLGPRSLKQSKG